MESSGTLQIVLSMPEYETLKQHKGRKFDVLQLANNHVMDNGEEGIMLNMNISQRMASTTSELTGPRRPRNRSKPPRWAI